MGASTPVDVLPPYRFRSLLFAPSVQLFSYPFFAYQVIFSSEGNGRGWAIPLLDHRLFSLYIPPFFSSDRQKRSIMVPLPPLQECNLTSLDIDLPESLSHRRCFPKRSAVVVCRPV